MQRERWVYYIAFPAVTFGLCGFSYYLGFSRGMHQGREAFTQTQNEQLLMPHEVKQDLTFFDKLREDQKPIDVELKRKTRSNVVKAEPKEAIPAIPLDVPKTPKEPIEQVVSDSKKRAAHPAIKSSSDKMVVQISSFRDLGRAHELTDTLKNKGYPAFVHSVNRGPVSWYRVYVGPYVERRSATVVLSKLSKEGFQPGFLTKMNDQ
jgi:cell division septation protein DedD